VRDEHLEATVVDVPEKPEEVVLKEHYARFINLQRYVVTESEGKDGKLKQKIVKLHPVVYSRRNVDGGLVAGPAMTPSDLMDLWKRIRAIFNRQSSKT
jgi:DNA helicase HerA-like ATPase